MSLSENVKAQSIEKSIPDVEARISNEPTFMVEWNGPLDPEKPINWSPKRRWTTIVVLSVFAIFNSLCSTALSPAIGAVAQDLSITDPVIANLCLSVYLLGIGIGPLLFGPLCEMYGRRPILVVGNIFFLAWNTGSGFVTHEAELVICRFFGGIGSSAALSVLSPSVSDMFPPESRGRARSIAIIASFLGPAVGPIAAGYITQYTSWRWVPWAISLLDVVVLVPAIAWLKETYPTQILRQKARRLRKLQKRPFVTLYDTNSQTLLQKLCSNFVRPLRMIGTQPIIVVLCVFYACLYGAMFLVLFSFPKLWLQVYGQSVGQSGLNYISTAVGSIIAGLGAGAFSDYISVSLKRAKQSDAIPEFRIPLMWPGACISAIGLVVFGWTGEDHLHWILPDIGIALFMAGIEVSTQVVQTYTLDAYTRYGASALSTMNLVRALAAFLLPLAAPSMYARLDWGWGSTVLALLIFTVGSIGTLVLWNFGGWLRSKSPYAAGGYIDDK